MNKGKKTLKRGFCIILAATMAVSLASCKKSGNASASGNVSGLLAEANDSSKFKDAVFHFQASVNPGFRTNRLFVKDGQPILFADRYDDGSDADVDMSDVMEDADVTEDASEVTEEETKEENKEDTKEENKEETSEVTGEDTEDGSEEETEDADLDADFDGVREAVSKVAWVVGDQDGNFGSPVVLELGSESGFDISVGHANLTPDGNITILVQKLNMSDYSTTYKVLKAGLDGKVVSEADLDTKGISDADNVYVLENGMCAVFGSGTVTFFGDDLKKAGEVKLDDVMSLNSVISSESGRFFVVYYDNSYNNITREIFPSEGRVGEVLQNTYGGNSKTVAGKGYDMETFDSTAIYGINVEANNYNKTQIMNFLDSDVLVNYPEIAGMLDPETAIIYSSDNSDICGIYKKVAPEDVKDKIVITAGGVYSPGYDVMKQILKFNQTNDQYRIRVYDYEKFITDEDFYAGETQFKNDILSGSAPDVIFTEGMLNPGIYATKGLFEDLYPYLDKNGIKKEDYLENVLSTGTYDGKLCILTPKFIINFVAIKDSVLQGRKGLTIQEMIDLEKEYNCEGRGFSGVSRDELLDSFVGYTGDSYYNCATGECHFDSPDFINALNWIKKYPEKTDDLNSMEDLYKLSQNEEVLLHKNEALVKNKTLFNLREFPNVQDLVFGEKIDLIGFPGSQKPESGLISPTMGVAINSKSQYKDAAFEFVKYYLSDEYQMPSETESDTYAFPIKKDALDKLIEIQTERPFEYDEATGKKTYYDYQTYSLSKGDLVKIDPISAEDAQRVKEFIYKCDSIMSYDKKVQEIVKEEVAPFFAGQKSAEEVANIIQSRVTIYVKENQ